MMLTQTKMHLKWQHHLHSKMDAKKADPIILEPMMAS